MCRPGVMAGANGVAGEGVMDGAARLDIFLRS